MSGNFPGYGQPFRPAVAIGPGAQLGPYRLLRRVGRGGMADVFAAEHLGLGKYVAVKVLHDHLAERADIVQRFALEGKAAARIRHPNIVDVSDVGSDGGVSYLVMELLEGEPLSRYLTRVGVLTPRQTAILMTPIIAAVAHAHRHGVLHRDLKPANIFLTQTPEGGMQPKVLDFGISKVLGANQHALTMTSSFVGTPAHASPEQVLGAKDVDARSDQYSLGVVLYACITGTLPFDPDAPLFELMRAVSEGNYARPAALRADLPPEFEAIVLRSMARDRDHRYPTLDDLRAALAPFAMHSVPSELPAAETDPGEEVATEVPVPSSSGIRGAPPRMAIAQTLTPSQASFPTPIPSHYAGVSTPAPAGYTPSGLRHMQHVSVPPSYTPSVPPGAYSGAYSNQPPAGSNRLIVLLLAALLLAVLGVGGGVVTVLLLSSGSNETTTIAPRDRVVTPATTMTETVVAPDDVSSGETAGGTMPGGGTAMNGVATEEVAMEEVAMEEVAMEEVAMEEVAMEEAAEANEADSDRDRRRRRRRSSMDEPAMDALMVVETQMVVGPQPNGTDIRDPWGKGPGKNKSTVCGRAGGRARGFRPRPVLRVRACGRARDRTPPARPSRTTCFSAGPN